MTVPITIRKYGNMSSKLVRKIHSRLIKEGAFPLSFAIAAVLHVHGGQLKAGKANKTAQSLGEANNARPSTVTGVW